MPEFQGTTTCPNQNRVLKRFCDMHVAYFSMEIGIDPKIPTYSGGLGVLAGDFLRSAADLNVPIVGVTLLYKKGYFRQKLQNGEQVEEEVNWKPEDFKNHLYRKIRRNNWRR